MFMSIIDLIIFIVVIFSCSLPLLYLLILNKYKSEYKFNIKLINISSFLFGITLLFFQSKLGIALLFCSAISFLFIILIEGIYFKLLNATMTSIIFSLTGNDVIGNIYVTRNNTIYAKTLEGFVVIEKDSNNYYYVNDLNDLTFGNNKKAFTRFANQFLKKD